MSARWTGAQIVFVWLGMLSIPIGFWPRRIDDEQSLVFGMSGRTTGVVIRLTCPA